MLKLDVVLPGLNEERGLENSVQTLSTFMREHLREYEWRIVIADNGSTDATPEIGRRLASERGRVEYLRLEQRGRGRALKHAWSQSDADVVAYMDMDLSTDLTYLPPLVKAVAEDGADVAIGSRLKRGAQVIGRSPKREFISRCYSLIFRTNVPDRIPGRAVRVQGGWTQSGGGGTPAGEGHGLVLRHGTADSVREERVQRGGGTGSVGGRP